MTDQNVPVLGESGNVYYPERPAVSEMSPATAEYLKDHGASRAERVDAAVFHADYQNRGVTEGGADPRTMVESTPAAQAAFNAYGILNTVADEAGPAATKLKRATEKATGRTLEELHDAILDEEGRGITETATAGVESTTGVVRAFPEPALDPAASEKVRTLAASWNLLPGSEILRTLQVWRDTGDPAWWYGRGFAQRAADNGKGWEQRYTGAFRDLLLNDRTPNGSAAALEAREWAATWGGVIRKRASSAMAELEDLAVRYRRQASE